MSRLTDRIVSDEIKKVPDNQMPAYEAHVRRCGECKNKLEEKSGEIALSMIEDFLEEQSLSAEEFVKGLKQHPEILDQLKRKQ